jgi:predicted PurR-regulated permease PerM
MLKEKLDYKLVNLALIALVVFLIHQTGALWMGFLMSFIKIIMPFFLAFVIAYSLNPIVVYLQSKKIKHSTSVLIVVSGFIAIIGIIFVLVIPLLFGQLSSFLQGITSFMQEIASDYNLQLGPIQESLDVSFNEFIKSLSTYVSDGAIKTIGASLNVIADAVITISAAIYFLSDFDDIREFIKKYLIKKSQRAFNYLKLLDHELRNYLNGMVKIMIIAIIEYTIAFTIIGHPNALLLGFLAAPANLIPYFGGLLNNVLAVVTAFVVGPTLFIKTIIITTIFSFGDSYLINPLVFGKTNKIHPIMIIFAVFAGGSMFGSIGIFLSLPIAIILISTYKFFKDDINKKIIQR